MRSTLYPSKEDRAARSAVSVEGEQRLAQALQELDELRRMNEKLFLLARRLQ